MIKFLGILAVILFWIIAVVLSPIIISVAAIIFVVSLVFAISSLVYESVTVYLKEKMS